MNSYQLSRKAALLLVINWALFAVCFTWTSKVQGSLLWWCSLNWSGWLADLGGLAQLTPVPAGTLWIGWLVLACLLTVTSWSRKLAVVAPQIANDPIANRQLLGNAEMMESHPELKEKLLRLHQSLDNI
jgi:hypothetical protein